MTRLVCLLTSEKYTPVDPAPEGYMAWHEWASVQHKAGYRQSVCSRCGKWRFPQEVCCLRTAQAEAKR